MFLKSYRSFPKSSVSFCKSSHTVKLSWGKEREIKSRTGQKNILHGFESDLSGFLPSSSTWRAMQSLCALNASSPHDYLDDLLMDILWTEAPRSLNSSHLVLRSRHPAWIHSSHQVSWTASMPLLRKHRCKFIDHALTMVQVQDIIPTNMFFGYVLHPIMILTAENFSKTAILCRTSVQNYHILYLL